MRTAVAAVFFIYLLCQSVSDARTMRVYVWANNAALAFGAVVFALYEARCAFPGAAAVELALVSLFVAMVTNGSPLSVCKTYGTGDAKAVVAMYMSAHAFDGGGAVPSASLAFALVALLVANVSFLVWNAPRRGGSRRAFFPFIAAGYASAVALFAWRFGFGTY